MRHPVPRSILSSGFATLSSGFATLSSGFATLSSGFATLALLGACTDPKTTPAPVLLVSPDSLDLGTVTVGEEASGEIVLSNGADGEIGLLGISIVAGDTFAWSLSHGDIAPLSGDDTATITLVFAPTEEGASSATLDVRTDVSDATIALTGMGEAVVEAMDEDGDGYTVAEGDCDDGNVDAHPGADEACDGVDSDCDGETPDDEADADADGWRVCDDDCDDTVATVYPGAEEVCDDLDSDCDGTNPDRDDADADGYTVCDDDCDDLDPDSLPGGVEACDGADNDCSGVVDDVDADGDGASACGDVPDCDDEDPSAFPVFVDLAATGGTGSIDAPFSTIADALAGLDDTCRTVGLATGTYDESVDWSDGALAIVGMGTDAGSVVLTPTSGSRSFTVSGNAGLTLANLTLAGATPTDGEGGGALLATDADVTLSGVVAWLNTSEGDGGALSVTSGTLTLADGCLLSDNTAAGDGGAVAVAFGALVDDGTTGWTGNRAATGGGLFAASSDVTMGSALFEDNLATEDGGAIALVLPGALAITGPVLLSNAATVRGGGLVIGDVSGASGYVRNVRALGNSAEEGGGFAIVDGDSLGDGGATLVVGNNTLVGNTASGDGGALYVDAGVVLFANLFAWNDGDTGLYGGADAWIGWNLGYGTDSGTDFSLAVDLGDNTVADPTFTDFTDNGDPTDDDLTLDASSPAVDAGPADDAEGVTYTWSDTDGSTNDLGYTGGPGAE